MSFIFKNVSLAPVLHDVSFTLPRSGFVAIIGPNGAGKSSLMKLMAAWHKPSYGQIDYGGQNLHHYSAEERANAIAWLPQEREVIWALNVEQIIALGCYNQPKPDFMDSLLKQTDLYALRHRKFNTLSGGEKNRVHIARLMATQTQTWLLDEIDAGLDWRYNLRIFSFLKQQAQTKLIIAVLHDLNMAKKISHMTLLMHQGKLAHWGESQKVMRADILEEIWQIPIEEGDDGWLKPILLLS